MSAETLLRELTDRGASLTREGPCLRVRAPRGILTQDVREALAVHKPAILELLSLARLQANRRPVLHFRVSGSPANAWATIIGRPGESVSAMRAELRSRFGGELMEMREVDA